VSGIELYNYFCILFVESFVMQGIKKSEKILEAHPYKIVETGRGKSEMILKELCPLIVLKNFGHTLPFDYAIGYFLEYLPFLY